LSNDPTYDEVIYIDDVFPLENEKLEHKAYTGSLENYRAETTIRTTVCSFLNSGGGNLYIGVDDSTGEIKESDMKTHIEYILERDLTSVKLKQP